MSDTYRFGIEEEYFLVEAATKSVACELPEAFVEAAMQATAGGVKIDEQQSQAEVATVPHIDTASAREELRRLRMTLAQVAGEYGLAIMAAGTHPTAARTSARSTPCDATLIPDPQMLGQLNMLCGLHVHVELPDPDERLDTMVRMMPYLPLFVALATSSPFWQSLPTGLKGYRQAAYDKLPRTGVPELFRTPAEYKAYIAALKRAGVIESSSYVWWAIRPSLKHPTLELRATDCCTRVEDSIAITALYRCLVSNLVRDPWRNWDMTAVSRAIVVENKWRAERYGVTSTFVDEEHGAISVSDLLDQVIEETRRDAEALGCVDEVEHCRTIAGFGTSADVQLAVFEQAHGISAGGGDPLSAVNDWIAEATLQ
ncbi:MAG TPA: carboxylate-amine ligase [Xanthobacteraceae bacterium]|nr:carboxylate-amine ligase [Xanthobacteraceae bacterium]